MLIDIVVFYVNFLIIYTHIFINFYDIDVLIYCIMLIVLIDFIGFVIMLIFVELFYYFHMVLSLNNLINSFIIILCLYEEICYCYY